MEAVSRLHALPGLAIAGALLLLALAAGALAAMDRAPVPWLDLVRRVLLALLVAEAAIGLVLVLRGSSPAEWIHWVYGGAIVAILLLPAAVATDGTPRVRSGALAAASALAALLAWRLWGSG